MQAACEEDAVKAFSKTVHSALDGKLATKGKVSCQMCHGDGAAHIEAEGDAPMVNYKDGNANTKAGACLDCHKTTTLRLARASMVSICSMNQQGT